jgi:hypothetical protein
VRTRSQRSGRTLGSSGTAARVSDRRAWTSSAVLAGGGLACSVRRRPAIQKPGSPSRRLLRCDVQFLGDLPILESVRCPQHDARTLYQAGR